MKGKVGLSLKFFEYFGNSIFLIMIGKGNPVSSCLVYKDVITLAFIHLLRIIRSRDEVFIIILE